jgi:TonB-linked SusC/RagA family outer membrane protein
MKKIGLNTPNGHRYAVLKRGLFIMKITLLLFLTTTFNLFATGIYSQTARVTVNLNQASIKQVLKEIEKSSEFYFLYNDNLIDVDRKVDIHVEDEQINAILNLLFDSDKVKFEVYDRQIVISPSNSPLPQQELRKAAGKVTDKDGLSLPGVSVVVKGTTNGTVTDNEGKFSLTLTPDDKIVVFSFIGMKTQELTVTGSSLLTVKLLEDAIGIEEVVAIGYGTMKKKDLTGSVSSLNSADVQKRGTTSVLEAMQGQIAGVNISNKSGRAGSGFNIQIRGLNTLSGSSEPLYVVDGVVTGINFLNPSDIARIDVLKDASSTAIYGSRGSNGVVIITTKTSSEVKKDVLQVAYDGYYGVRSTARVPEFMGGDEWLHWRTDAWMVFNGTDANNVPIYNYGSFGQDPTPNVFCQSPLLLERYKNKDYTDWFDETTKDGSQQNHYINIEGISKTLKYSLGLGYQDEKGIVPNDDYRRYNLKVSLENQISKRVKAGANMSFAISERNLGSSAAMSSLFSPLTSPYDQNGKLQPQPGSIAGIGSTTNLSFTNNFNPVIDQQNVTNNDDSKFLLANLFVNVEIVDGLTFNSTLSPNYFDSRKGIYQAVMSSSQYTKNIDFASLATSRGMSYTWDNIVNFKKEYGLHRLDLMGMQNLYQGSSETSFESAEDFPYNSSFYNMNNAKKMISMGSSYSKQSLLSFAGRANYVYNNKYYATATIRWDGSSKLAEKWASFPSFAVAWKLSEEEFMKFDALSNLKLRLSYGYTGNNNISPYGTSALANTKTYYDYGGTIANGFAPNGVVNQSLTWERTKEIDIAVDYGFFKNRINGSIDVYNKTSKGLLMDRKLPVETGWISMTDNIGSVNNKGIEIALNTINLSTNNLRWETSFTFAKNINKIVELYGGTTDDVQNRWFIGEPVNVVYGYVYDGVWTREEKDLAAKYGQREGMAKVKDFDASDTKHSIDLSDRRILGSPMPSWTGGFTSNLSYRSFDFTFSLNTRQGVYVYSPSISKYMDYSDRGGQKLSVDFYRPAGTPMLQPDATFLPGKGNPSQEAPMAYTNNAGTWWHTSKNDPNNEKPGAFGDASFTKVQNITLGYTLKRDWVERMKMKSLRIYLNVRDPFVFTDYKGFDPEWAEASITGEDAGSYGTITWQIGANVKF